MTVNNPPGWLQNAGAIHTAQQLRVYEGSLLAGKFTSSEPSRSLGGVHPTIGGSLGVQQNGSPNMSVNVLAGICYIPGSESSLQGVYSFHNDGTVNLSIATAPGAGLNRIDLIVAKVEDTFYSGSNNTASLAVVTGSAAASPTAPTAPNNSLVLAQVFVGSNVTSIVTANITDKRYYAAALGGIIPCSSTTRPNQALLTPGQVVFEGDTEQFSWTDGTAWNPVSKLVQSVTVSSFPSTTNVTSTSYVNYILSIPTFIKRYASSVTKLKVTVHTSGFFAAVVNTVSIGVNFNGTDFDITKKGFNNAASHQGVSGMKEITTLVANSYAVNLRAKVDASTFTSDGADAVSMCIEEIAI